MSSNQSQTASYKIHDAKARTTARDVGCDKAGTMYVTEGVSVIRTRRLVSYPGPGDQPE